MAKEKPPHKAPLTKASDRPSMPPEAALRPARKQTASPAQKAKAAATGQKTKSAPVAQKTRSAIAPPDPKRVAEVFRRFQAADPHPEGELDYINPFTLLIAVVLSAQATDKGVNKATPALFAAADSPQKMLALGEDKVREFIRTIGLYRTKAKHVIALSRAILETFGGKVPQTREALETLPGVGRKTANVVMNIAFGAPTIAVDTHIFRVSNRVPLARGRTPLEVEKGLEAIIPPAFKQHAHHWLILHGRYVCKARRPECERCVIADLCTAPDKRI